MSHLLNPNDIDVVVNYHLDNSNFEIIVPSHPTNEKIENPNIVKIVSNDKGEVVYFSRSLIPNNFKAKKVFFHRHLSIVSFKPETLQKFANLEPSNLEKIEDVELLRALENKIRIGTLSIKGNSFSVDTKDDLAKAKKLLKMIPSENYINKKKIFIFDLDGVLIDSKKNMKKSWSVVKKKFLLKKNFKDYEKFIGLKFLNILQNLRLVRI